MDPNKLLSGVAGLLWDLADSAARDLANPVAASLASRSAGHVPVEGPSLTSPGHTPQVNTIRVVGYSCTAMLWLSI
jgi:hypothetical protein